MCSLEKDEDMLSHHSITAGLVLLPERRYLRSTTRTKIMAFLPPTERAGEGGFHRGGMKALSEDG